MASEPRNILRTFRGTVLNLDNLRPGDIRLADIAMGLSKECRFSGQVAGEGFPSVLLHSLVVENLAREKGLNEAQRLQALLHDAAEAFTGDIPSPIKRRLRGYGAIERVLLKAIYGFLFPPGQVPAVRMPTWLKELDDQALRMERIVYGMVGETKICPDESIPRATLRGEFMNRARALMTVLWGQEAPVERA